MLVKLFRFFTLIVSILGSGIAPAALCLSFLTEEEKRNGSWHQRTDLTICIKIRFRPVQPKQVFRSGLTINLGVRYRTKD